MGGEPAVARVLASSSGRMQKSDSRVDVRLLAYQGCSVRTVVDLYAGVRFVSSTVVAEGNGAMEAMLAGRVFNETVEKLKKEGFRGLKRIDVIDPYPLAEAFVYVSLTGNQPHLNERFELQLTEAAAAELAALDRTNGS